MLPPLPRIPQALDLVQNKKYFVLHAPRQSGKTTSIRALCDILNRLGKFYAIDSTLEVAGVGSEQEDVIMDVTTQIWLSTHHLLLEKGLPDLKPDASIPKFALQIYLTELCKRLDKPLVLLLDEVDVLSGHALLSLLRQLRAGYVT
ncbi:MAG: hypothetical protein J6866_07505, partial [Victivallales bacterium]|nr:hypothetical protein [Victivallales bacterium]